ncbi:MAG: RHS repeat-associated core domain-containing protein [Flavobacterium sp. JAD_PAG50586_2]|nr:MAG: RHS repeat-associated core domain-containing protein [Flavobacterium sp. JAD_PAG50586_2]
MRKLLFILIAAVSVPVLAQTTSQNYVKTTIYRGSLSGNPSHSVTYFDGLGRPIQQIAGKQSNTGKDIVTHIEYDSIGRQKRDYLPAIGADNLAYTDGASLRSIVIGQYQAKFPGEGSYPYSEKLLENSPLNRVRRQAAEGKTWAMGNGHEVRFDYQANEASEVRFFRVTTAWDGTEKLYTPIFVDDGFYVEYQLYKTITKNENWKSGDGTDNTTESFKDKEGRVVLKRTYNLNVAHDTYYVYDDFGNLTYVLPPLVDTGNSIGQAILDNLCYQYQYDSRNRLVKKKLPGKQWEYIVYNSQDKPVATGPAVYPFGDPSEGWLITKYDAFGRVAYTGWHKQDGIFDRVVFQDAMDAAGSNWMEVFSDTTPTTIDSFELSYSNTVYPTTEITLLTVNYYDGYTYKNAPTVLPGSVDGQPLLTNAKGLATGSWVRVLTNPSETRGNMSYTLYDKKSRPVRSHTENYLGGFTNIDTLLDFAGKTIYTKSSHKRTNADVSLSITNSYEYTPEDRLLMHTQQINGGVVERIAQNEYDALGQLISKGVGGTGTALQKVDFKYNIRGWLTNINNTDDLNLPSVPKDLFAFRISYNDPQGTGSAAVPALYNGNISETNWISSTDNILRRYGYTYDSLNRLSNAIYQKPNNAVPVTNMYNESMGYDKNGNIKKLKRWGDFDSDIYAAIKIDELHYYYENDNKNRLMKVTDASNSPKGFYDDTITDPADASDDYGYDDYGNMTSDENKKIMNIVYNHLNLPVEINFGAGNKIEYLYDASGRKLWKKATENTSEIDVDYLDGFQYMNGVLDFFPHAEGYVKVLTCPECEIKRTFNYVYQYKDHLGNIRMSYGVDPEEEEVTLKILEENHYYPFGLKHTKYNSNEKMYELVDFRPTIKDILAAGGSTYKYKYNGKEYQDELGLNMYDYGARNYDPALGRWMNIDPLAEKYRRWSPYNYCMDNPVIFTDPDGMHVDTAWIYQKDKKGNYINKDLVKAFNVFAKSKEGIAFLANFAEKGQVIAGHEYNESGQFDQKDIDLKFGGSDSKMADAETTSQEKGKGIEITISLGTIGKADALIDDIGHESFLHAESIGNDFYDDKKLNLSNIDKDIVKNLKDNNYSKKWTPNAAQHHQARRHEILEKKLVPILKNYYKNNNIKKSDAEIKESVNYYRD